MGTLGAGVGMSSTNSATGTLVITLRHDINTQCCNSGILNQFEIHTKSRGFITYSDMSSAVPGGKRPSWIASAWAVLRLLVSFRVQSRRLLLTSWSPALVTWERFGMPQKIYMLKSFIFSKLSLHPTPSTGPHRSLRTWAGHLFVTSSTG